MRLGWLIVGGATLALSWAVFSWSQGTQTASAQKKAKDADEIAALKETVEQLNARLAQTERLALLGRTEAAMARPSPGEGRPDANGDKPTSPVSEVPPDDAPLGAPYPEAKEKEYFGMYFGELDRVMTEQGHDRQLTSELSKATAVDLVPERLGKLVSLSCSTEICRVELEQKDPAKRREFTTAFMRAAAAVIEHGTVHIPTDETKLVGYFSKRGADLPAPSVSFAAVVEGRADENPVD